MNRIILDLENEYQGGGGLSILVFFFKRTEHQGGGETVSMGHHSADGWRVCLSRGGQQILSDSFGKWSPTCV